MKPTDPGGTGELVTYAADQPEYNPLITRREADGTVRTRWQLSDEERRAIIDGACVELELLTFGRPLQPIRIFITGTEGLVELPEDVKA